MTLTIPASLGGGSQQFTYCADGSFRNESNSVLIKLMEEENGQVYLFQKGYTQLPGLAPLCTASYGYERLPEHKISEETRAAWASYSNTFYVLVNEKYSSGLYPFGATFAAVGLSDTEPGYMLSYQLQDAHTAVPFVQIPGTGSRDSSVITIAEQNGIDYLSMSGSLYQDAADVSPIYAGNAKCTIQENGYARWYQTGDRVADFMFTTPICNWSQAPGPTVIPLSHCRKMAGSSLPAMPVIPSLSRWPHKSSKMPQTIWSAAFFAPVSVDTQLDTPAS